MRKIPSRFEVKSGDAYIANNKQMFAVTLIANLAVITLF